VSVTRVRLLRTELGQIRVGVRHDGQMSSMAIFGEEMSVGGGADARDSTT